MIAIDAGGETPAYKPTTLDEFLAAPNMAFIVQASGWRRRCLLKKRRCNRLKQKQAGYLLELVHLRDNVQSLVSSYVVEYIITLRLYIICGVYISEQKIWSVDVIRIRNASINQNVKTGLIRIVICDVCDIAVKFNVLSGVLLCEIGDIGTAFAGPRFKQGGKVTVVLHCEGGDGCW